MVAQINGRVRGLKAAHRPDPLGGESQGDVPDRGVDPHVLVDRFDASRPDAPVPCRPAAQPVAQDPLLDHIPRVPEIVACMCRAPRLQQLKVPTSGLADRPGSEA